MICAVIPTFGYSEKSTDNTFYVQSFLRIEYWQKKEEKTMQNERIFLNKSIF